MLSLFRLALGKIMLENTLTNPMNTSSYIQKKKRFMNLHSVHFHKSCFKGAAELSLTTIILFCFQKKAEHFQVHASFSF